MIKSHFFTGLAASVVFAISAASVQAAYLQFNPSSASVGAGNTFQTSVIVNAGSDEVSSTDAYVLFDSTYVEFQSFTAGTFFPYVVHNVTAGKVAIRGIVEDAATSRTGSGTLATLTFRVLTPGTATLSFFCDLNASDTSKIVKSDLNATNLIICTQNNTLTATILSPTPTGTAGGASPTGTGNPNTNPNGSASSGTNSGNASTGSNSGTQGGPGSGGNANIGGNVAPPSQLPQSGGLENLRHVALAGSLLFIVGGIVSLIF